MSVIGDLTDSVGDALLRRAGRVAGRVQETRGLDADLLESEEAFLVVFDAPGATGTDVQVRYSGGGVEVRVDRFREFYEGYDMRFPGRGLSLDGEVDLPAGATVDPDAASATLTAEGTLEVVVPKREPSPPGDRATDEEGIAVGEESTDEADGERHAAEETGAEDGGAEETGAEDTGAEDAGAEDASVDGDHDDAADGSDAADEEDDA
jgi:HSP20 family molecular chaperone IbpA